MRISVIVPTYNRAACVADAIESILAQTRPADEIIVIDDGSSDDTIEVLAPYRDRIELITQANAGVSAARNAGIARATGNWIAFLDSDDVWLPGRLESLANADMSPNVGVHVADVVFEGPGYEESLFAIRGFTFEAQRITEIERPLHLLFSGLSLMSIAARRDWLTATGGFDPNLRMFEDLDVLTRLALAGPWAFTPDIVCRARRIEEDPSLALTVQAARNQARTAAGRVHIFERLAKDTRLTPDERQRANRALSGALFGEAGALQLAGAHWLSMKPLFRSTTVHPSLPRGTAKAAAMLILGQRRYAALRAAKRGFHREDFTG